MVVAGALGLQERGPAGDLGDGAEAEDVAVEGAAARDVAHVEDGVVEALDGHEDLLGKAHLPVQPRVRHGHSAVRGVRGRLRERCRQDALRSGL